MVVTGMIDVERIFAAVRKIEEKAVAKANTLPPYVRPWQEEVPPLDANISREILFPCDDEDNGIVHVAWRGPQAVGNLYAIFATAILMEYLTDSSISPLQKVFVESDDPLASSVDYSMIENRDCCVYLSFDNVPLEKLPEVEVLLAETLKDIVNETKEKFDMKRMRTLIQRRILQMQSESEVSPHSSVAHTVIADALYGNTTQDVSMDPKYFNF